ncbi:uncharacterized protein V1510DRAFT_424033 [Dipodascopsis tothii]|uniref:uncharacterized protein n=1 Tax=Dipodascopsis tothii TaxID=44089 RepID=UPI0034CF494D
MSIQDRVKALLAQSQTAPAERTATGYGPYTDTDEPKPLGRASTIGDVDTDIPQTYLRIEADGLVNKAGRPVYLPESDDDSSRLSEDEEELRERIENLGRRQAATASPAPAASPASPAPKKGKPKPPPKPSKLQGASPSRLSAGTDTSIDTSAATITPDAEDGDWMESFQKKYPRLSGIQENDEGREIDLLDVDSPTGSPQRGDKRW